MRVASGYKEYILSVNLTRLSFSRSQPTGKSCLSTKNPDFVARVQKASSPELQVGGTRPSIDNDSFCYLCTDYSEESYQRQPTLRHFAGSASLSCGLRTGA